MSEVRLTVEMSFESASNETDEQFEEFLDDLQERLDALGAEVHLSASLANRTVDVATSSQDPTLDMLADGLLMDLRTALLAIGGDSPSWLTRKPGH